MTLATLEITPIEDLDFATPCHNCAAAAEYEVITFCCPRLNCGPCKDAFIETIESYDWASIWCDFHPENKIYPTKVSDIIISVDKL